MAVGTPKIHFMSISHSILKKASEFDYMYIAGDRSASGPRLSDLRHRVLKTRKSDPVAKRSVYIEETCKYNRTGNPMISTLVGKSMT